MIGQLVLVTYMWLQKDKYLIIMGDVVEKAWQKRTTSADYMDAIQISVCYTNCLCVYMNYNFDL